jgi:hypothetical protein
MFDLAKVYKRARGGWMIQFAGSRRYFIFTLRRGFWRPARELGIAR